MTRTFRAKTFLAIACGALALASCESGATHPTGPVGAGLFSNFIVIGTGLSMGVQSGGVVYSSQAQAWPAILAAAEGAPSFRMPLLRTPGCHPPLVAPLNAAVYLSGVSTAGIDSSCAGASDTLTPPFNNVAIAGATAWAALNLTPKIVANSTTPVYGAGDKARYPLVLASTQSQVTAMRIEVPTFVAVELGLGEVLRAVTSGLLVPATSYTQAASYTYVPASVFAPVYAAIADTVKLTGVKTLLISVPRVTQIAGLRPALEIWNDRANLGGVGVNVNANCATSANFIFVPTVIGSLVGAFNATDSAQTLSCADTPGAADGILTPADVATLDGVVTAMNAQIQQIAQTNHWAFADLTGVFPADPQWTSAYSALSQFTCVRPYGWRTSLDGIFPNAQGQIDIATAASSAIKNAYGLSTVLENISVNTGLIAQPCP